MIELRRATLSDMHDIAPRLLPDDQAECQAASGLPPEMILPLSLSSSEVWVFTIDGRPETVLGLSPVSGFPFFGQVWMLTTAEILKHKRYLIKKLPEVMDMLHDRYPLLGNHADCRNTTHIRLIRRCGFSLLRVIPEYGVARLPFIEFAKIRQPAHV